MIELDAEQLRRIAGVLDSFALAERETGIAIDGHRGFTEITVEGGVNPAVQEVLVVARPVAADVPRYVLRVGD